MTLTAGGYVLAALIAVAGGFVAWRIGRGRARPIMLLAAVLLALIIGWFAWLLGTSV